MGVDIVAQWTQLLLARPAIHIRVLARVPVTLLLIQLHANMLDKVAEDEPNT